MANVQGQLAKAEQVVGADPTYLAALRSKLAQIEAGVRVCPGY